jgi:Transglutaminase-like superfamily
VNDAAAAAAGSTSWWREVFRLDALQWRYLFMSLAWLPVIDMSLRRVGYKRTLLWLSRRADSDGASINHLDSPDVPSKIARMVSLAGRRSPWRTTCLRQALLLWFLLARRGIASELRLGVEKSAEGDVAAHAWVERDGHVLIGGEYVQHRYIVLH